MGTILFLAAIALLAFVVRSLIMSRHRVQTASNEIEVAEMKLSWQKTLGWSLVAIAVGIVIMPLPGITLRYGTGAILIAGCVFLYKFYFQPKVREYLILADLTHGYLTKMLVLRKLGLPESVIKRTFKHLLQNGDVLILNPDKQRLSDLIFLVRSYSGRLSGEDTMKKEEGKEAKEPTSDDEIREQHMNVVEMGVDQLNDALLHGSLTLGRSGRPVR